MNHINSFASVLHIRILQHQCPYRNHLLEPPLTLAARPRQEGLDAEDPKVPADEEVEFLSIPKERA